MTIHDGLVADRAGNLQLAATRYEELLESGDAAPEMFVNLAVLYWQSTDTGIAAGMRLPNEFFDKASRRWPELLAEFERRFPASSEGRFWKRYIGWADLGEPFGIDECRKLLQEDPTSLVPAMYLFSFSQGKEAEREARELLRLCREDGTTRAGYVSSVIEAVLRRAMRR